MRLCVCDTSHVGAAVVGVKSDFTPTWSSLLFRVHIGDYSEPQEWGRVFFGGKVSSKAV